MTEPNKPTKVCGQHSCGGKLNLKGYFDPRLGVSILLFPVSRKKNLNFHQQK